MRTIRFHSCILLTIMLASAATTWGQDIAQQVYSSTQDSVFLVYLNDDSGNPTALGTAFLVAPRLLITNAHVADAGTPVLAIGPVRLPLKVLRTDEKNDLAVLSVGVDLTSKPLALSSAQVSPGQQVFAIGNPIGLEKTISQGIVAGLRSADGRNLIQITSPISHGSSGGPILNSRGEVIGVTVGMLEEGQNINFAVPVSYVKSILSEKGEGRALGTTLSAEVTEANRLFEKRRIEDYSADADSDYQKQGKKLLSLIQHIESQSEDPTALEAVACMGTEDPTVGDEGILAAKKLVRTRATTHDRELLAYTLYERAAIEEISSAFAADGSKEKENADAEHRRYLADATQEALDITERNRAPHPLVAAFVLGKQQEEHADYPGAVALFSAVAAGAPKPCGNDLAKTAYTSLITISDKSKKPQDAEMWFGRYAAKYQPSSYDWDAEGDRRNAAEDYRTAGQAYERAAKADNDYAFDFCYAAAADYYQTPTEQDGVLENGRRCLEASVKGTSESSQLHFKAQLPAVFRYMAEVLESRGVNQAALQYIKESLAAKSDDPFSLSTEADILEDLQRYTECIAAAQSAITLSDGKYPAMHFRLGSCYFDTENWEMAAASFRRAADSNKNDAVSAFNLGLSLARQGFSSDAQVWFGQALSRNPSPELRTKIQNAMR